MTRVETIGVATLYLGDCREILPTLGKVDAVVTDPPYGISEKWAGEQKGKRGKSVLWNGNNEWDSETSPAAVQLALALVDKAIIWGGNYYDLPPCRQYLIWDKIQSFSNSDSEYAWTNLTGAARTFRMSRIDAYQNKADSKKSHPTEKPVELMKWCIGFVPDAKTILDPFMGSGTTGVAAVKLGRKFIGIEIEPKYFDIACRRIEEATKQSDLFIERPAPVKQEAFI